MPIHVVADTPASLDSLRSTIERRHAVTSELLRDAKKQPGEIDALVIKADLRAIDAISALKEILGTMTKVRKRIFLVEDSAHRSVSQAYAFGATSVLTGPLDRARLLNELNLGSSPEKPSADSGATAEAAAAHGEIALASMFTSVAGNMPIDVAGAKNAGARIAAAIEEHGLSTWMTDVRRHHEGTYQHCLLVTGVAIDFGLSLGFPKCELERLYTSAMFHDVGKAKIPLAVLDKPGKLDPAERALIETHPGTGYDILKDNQHISPEVLDAVRHHHEYLDGSGYPDGLCAENICDLVRVLTISDVFAALIERRSYKPTMPRADAYDILCRMDGKLEKPLLRAFKTVALDR